MTVLPIVERELRSRARRRGVYTVRTVGAALAILLAGVMLFLSALPSRGGGSGLFTTLSCLAFLLCFFEGARQASDSLSGEKREGTLGLLFLTDLSGCDVVLGKMVAISLNSFYALLGMMPVLALPLMMGGVTGIQFWQMSLLLVNTLFFAVSTGMLISAMSWREGRAWAGTLFVMLAVTAGAPLVGKISGWTQAAASRLSEGGLSVVWYWALEPFVLLGNASPAGAFFKVMGGGAGAGEFWLRFGVLHTVSWGFLWVASRHLPQNWQDKPRAGEVVSFPAVASSVDSPGRPPANAVGAIETVDRRVKRQALLDVNAVAWLSTRNGSMEAYALLVALVAVVVSGSIALGTGSAAGLLYVLWPSQILLSVGVAFQSCRVFAEARKSGAMEMLMVTPLTWNEIVKGQVLGVKQVFLKPVMVLLAGFSLFAVIPGVFLGGNWTQPFGIGVSGASWLIWLCRGGSFIAGLFAVSYVGMWLALRTKNPATAVGLTILWVVILPRLVMCCFPFFLDLIIEIVMIVVAKQSLEKGDRWSGFR